MIVVEELPGQIVWLPLTGFEEDIILPSLCSLWTCFSGWRGSFAPYPVGVVVFQLD